MERAGAGGHAHSLQISHQVSPNHHRMPARTLCDMSNAVSDVVQVMQGSSCKTVERFVPVNMYVQFNVLRHADAAYVSVCATRHDLIFNQSGPGCGFVIGPPSVDSDSTTPLSVPRVCVGPGDEVLNMAVFQVRNAA